MPEHRKSHLGASVVLAQEPQQNQEPLDPQLELAATGSFPDLRMQHASDPASDWTPGPEMTLFQLKLRTRPDLALVALLQPALLGHLPLRPQQEPPSERQPACGHASAMQPEPTHWPAHSLMPAHCSLR